ncbi:MAG: hypothetical protein HYR94_06180 [Chloroflexi bacterium]|nr:hypothetical protein [Chloroflexota bacterium]
MADLSIHPVYLSARAAIVAPERAIPVTLYSAQKWLPRLGPERWCLVILLRGLCIDAPRRSDGTKRVTCSWRELAEMLDVHEETIASWLKHQPIPHDKPWRSIIPSDEKAKYLALFIPRLRYAYETYNGKTRRVGFLLEILMEDPVVPEDQARLQQQVELLRLQQGELGLETYRVTENVKVDNFDLPKISAGFREPQIPDSRLVNPQNLDLSEPINPKQSSLHKGQVKQDFSDLQSGVKQNNSNSGSYVNLSFSGLPGGKSVESSKNVNELDILIEQLKQTNLHKNSLRSVFEPIVRLTEILLNDHHSGLMFYKVLNALYPEQLDLYVAAIQVALNVAETDPQVNQGAVFVRALRDFADEAEIDLGLRQTSDRELARHEDDLLGTQVPNTVTPLPPLTPPSVNEAIWAETQSVLRPQMTRATYDTIIQGTMLLGRENGNYIVGVQTEMAKEWLENRLRDIVRRALSNVIGVAVNVEFRLMDTNK